MTENEEFLNAKADVDYWFRECFLCCSYGINGDKAAEEYNKALRRLSVFPQYKDLIEEEKKQGKGPAPFFR